MHEDEVLAAGFAHEARVADVLAEVLASLTPQRVERVGGTREVDAGEMLRLGGHLADERTATGQEVHHAVGQSGLLVELHQVVVREQGRRRGLPQRHVAHQNGRHAEVRGNRREVERRHGEHEAFQGAILGVVNLSHAVFRLHGVDFRCIVHVVAEEVDGFAGRVDFRLVDVLALAEHRGGVENGAIFRG